MFGLLGYIFSFLGHLVGFELFARETNLKKKSSVHMKALRIGRYVSCTYIEMGKQIVTE